jgi:universal stress protein A
MSNYQHLLIALDFTSAADAIARRAIELAKQHNARLTFVHIVEYLPPLGLGDEVIPTPEWVLDEQQLVKSAQQNLAEFCRRHNAADARQIALPGIPKHEIIRIAQEQNVDLIVIGSHGRHGLSRLLGSTTHAVLNDAPCDVLSVRLRE